MLPPSSNPITDRRVNYVLDRLHARAGRELPGLGEKPWTVFLASDRVTYISRALTSHYGSSVRRSLAARSAGFLASLATTKRARSKTVDPNRGSTGGESGCASEW
jgi:hypothetical protein